MEMTGLVHRMQGFTRLLLQHRLMLVVALEIAITAVSCWTAFILRFDLWVPAEYRSQMLAGLAISVLAKAMIAPAFGVHQYSFRYVCLQDLAKLVLVQVASSSLAALGIVTLLEGYPRSIHLVQLLISIVLTAGFRAGCMMACETLEQQRGNSETRNAVVYGAGAAGVALVRELRNNPKLPFHVKGFIDDQIGGKGLMIHGTRVLGRGEDLSNLARRYDLDVVLIAIPSAGGPRMASILENCRNAGLKSLTIPGMASLMEGTGLVRQLRDVAVEDLLGRNPVRLDQDKIRNRHSGKTILVTGAAGSIGSELCRQVARFGPVKIVGLDTAESGLFDLEQELTTKFPGVAFEPVVGSIQNAQRLAEVFAHCRPSSVYHAAAYKHVPMMEQHVFEAIENNVFGTLNVALAAARNQVEDFVMISSDKAVRPTNIMGATKRIAELVIRSLDAGNTKFVSVRFGNVLGSNGSVVPIFKRQIAQGGPVKVTHPEMRRYFMTIPEATQLVLQSATMSRGGEIFVLDMGEPVKIVDLARNLILLSGLKPDEDVRIEFTGTRPGEKLYEELQNDCEDMLPTYHEKIKIFAGTSPGWSTMERRLNELERNCTMRRLDELMLTVKELVPDYNPSTNLLRRVLQPAQEEFSLTDFRIETVQ